jgi:SSS family solute:Na+ symporter
MIDSTLFLVILGSLTALYAVFGIMASWHVTSQTDYFLAGRSLSIPAITGTLLATQIGGGMFLGTAQAPFEGLLYAVGMALGFLGLGLGIAARLRKYNVGIVSEIFELSYQSSTLFYITSVLSVLSMAGIIVGQIIAAKSIFVHFVGIESDWIFLTFWGLIIAYTMIGGLHAVVIADKIQITFIIAVFTGICVYGLYIRPTAFLHPTPLRALNRYGTFLHLLLIKF